MQEAGDLGNGGGGPVVEPIVQCSRCSLELSLRRTSTGKWMVSCQGSPNCEAAPLWFPPSVKEASVEANTCNSCNLHPRTVHLTMARGSLTPYYPDQLSVCLGGCDLNLLEMLGVGKLNSGAVARMRPDDGGRGVARGAQRGGRGDPRGRGGRGGPRGGGGGGRGDPRGGGGGGRGDPRGGGGAMAVGRAAARPRAGRGRGGEGRGRGRGRGAGSGDLNYDSGYNTQSQGASQAFQAKRQQLQDLNGGVAPVQPLACNCGMPAASRTVRKEGPNKGRDFFCCSKPQGEQCGFFKFADEVVAGGNQGGGGPVAAFGGGAGFGGGGGNVGGAVDAPVCQCGQVKVMRTVRKEGPTQGKEFFCCPKDRDQQCQQSFQWADEVAPNVQGGGGGVAGGGRGQARGRGRGEKRMREALGGEQGEKKQRKCGLCHQPGHTRNRCTLALICSYISILMTMSLILIEGNI